MDINSSHWDNTFEGAGTMAPANGPKERWGESGPAVRLGFRQVKGVRIEDAIAVNTARAAGGVFGSVEDFQGRTGKRLARADAFGSLSLTRRQAGWQSLSLTNDPMPLMKGEGLSLEKRTLFDGLPTMPAIQEVLTDYATAGLSLKTHPVSFARCHLESCGVVPAAFLLDEGRCPSGRWTRVAGLVLVRQRPGTASGVVFITLEDETGVANLVVWSHVYEMYRPAARHATLLQAEGVVQREGKVVHLVVQRLFDRGELLQTAGETLEQHLRNFH